MNHKQKTPFITKEEAQKNTKWYLFNAEGKTLGRFASEIAKVLRGKHKTDFTPNQDGGDGVVVINAEKIKVTGAKEAQKVYNRYTGYVGGLRTEGYRDLKKTKPGQILMHAVKGMMPRTKLGNAQLKKLRVFVGSEHNMQAQKPETINI